MLIVVGWRKLKLWETLQMHQVLLDRNGVVRLFLELPPWMLLQSIPSLQLCPMSLWRCRRRWPPFVMA